MDEGAEDQVDEENAGNDAAEDAETDVEKETDNDGDGVEINDMKEALTETMKFVAQLGVSIKELVETVGELKQSDEDRVAKQARQTPFASQLAMMQESVIGKDAARVDGRTALAKLKPQETKPEPRNLTGIKLVDSFIHAGN